MYQNPNSNIISERLQQFRLKESQLTAKKLSYWQGFHLSATTSSASSTSSQQSAPTVASPKAVTTESSTEAPSATVAKALLEPKPTNAPAQEKLSEELKTLKSQFYSMQSLENSGLSLVSSKDMTALKRKILEKEKAEKRLISKAKCEKERRLKLKETMTKLSQSSEVAAKKLKPFLRESPGRPALEIDCQFSSYQSPYWKEWKF